MNDILINSIKLNGIKSTHQTIHDWCFHCWDVSNPWLPIGSCINSLLTLVHVVLAIEMLGLVLDANMASFNGFYRFEQYIDAAWSLTTDWSNFTKPFMIGAFIAEMLVY